MELQVFWRLISSSLLNFPLQVSYGSPISAVMIDDSSAITTSEEDTQNMGILDIDSALRPFKDHFQYRIKKYVDQKNLFEKYEGGLEEFAKGHSNAIRFLICFYQRLLQ